MVKKLRIGVVCPSEIAFRRFLPALKQCDFFDYVGVAIANEEEWSGASKQQMANELKKAEQFQKNYGGKIFHGYGSIISSDEVDVVYLPLPPALHYKWAMVALENNKHVFVEKPATTSSEYTKKLIQVAKEKKLAIHENYMFVFHSQLEYIIDLLNKKTIGEVRLYRISFGFPKREVTDFRYNKALGGGALLDCGGYTLKLAANLLGNTAQIACAQMNYIDNIQVDAYGSSTIVNSEGVTAQVAFGMDNSYKCDLEIWGSKGTIKATRILTAPAGFKPELILKQGNEEETIVMPEDDTFKKSIEHMNACITDSRIREKTYNDLICQSKLVDEFSALASNK